jgi:hypothetical protein
MLTVWQIYIPLAEEKSQNGTPIISALRKI